MNHKRAQCTKSKSKKNVFLLSHLQQQCWEPECLSPSPVPPPPPFPAFPGWQIIGASPVSMPTLSHPPPIEWPNLKLNPAFRRQFCPSAAPGVLCGADPIQLISIMMKPSSAGWVLRGLGRNMPCPLERHTEGSVQPGRGRPGTGSSPAKDSSAQSPAEPVSSWPS
jgi:hypothetical protein